MIRRDIIAHAFLPNITSITEAMSTHSCSEPAKIRISMQFLHHRLPCLTFFLPNAEATRGHLTRMTTRWRSAPALKSCHDMVGMAY